MKTLVIGCTGVVGSHVVDGLLSKDVSVRCMSRSADKIKHLQHKTDGIAADLSRPETLPLAFDGIDSVFLAVPVSRNETDQGLNAVAAARSAGVKKIVYLSVYMPEGSSVIPHFRSKIPIENSIKISGIDYIILRPNNFFQNDFNIRATILEQGVYSMPIGSIGLNRIDVRDVADCAVNGLTQSGHEGRIFSLHGPDTLNGVDIARIYSRVLGRDVRYGGDDLDAWVQRIRNIMPEWLYRDMRIMFKYFQSHGMIAPESDLEKQQILLGHLPHSFEEFVQEVAIEWKQMAARAA